MHLQQTKARSRATGGPQYYFHDLTADVRDFLRKHGSCPVILDTPYGIAATAFTAVDKDHKLDSSGRIVRGRVGHDRIQQGEAAESIGEAIRRWYALKDGPDFERIELQVRIVRGSHFIIRPTAVKLRERARVVALEDVSHPLSFNSRNRSALWDDQFEFLRASNPAGTSWAGQQLRRVVTEHQREGLKHVHEADLLRTAGALDVLGMRLTPYRVTGFDCPNSRFQFRVFPEYFCEVEIKKRSSGFRYQLKKYADLPRAVVLCIEHDLVYMDPDVDVVELSTLSQSLAR